MKARRTFATSGIRAYLDFSINVNEMGRELLIYDNDGIGSWL